MTVTWDVQPSSQSVKEGDTVTFRCAATVNKKIEYHWSHNNKTIQTNSRFTIKSVDGTLEITDTQLDDRGTYQCYVTRPGRTKILGKSNTATLDVKGKITSETNKASITRVFQGVKIFPAAFISLFISEISGSMFSISLPEALNKTVVKTERVVKLV